MSKWKPKVTLEVLPCVGIERKDLVFFATSHRLFYPIGGPKVGPRYESNAVQISVGKDGHVHFSEKYGDGFIYFYPEQVGHLRKALAVLNRRAKEGKK